MCGYIFFLSGFVSGRGDGFLGCQPLRRPLPAQALRGVPPSASGFPNIILPSFFSKIRISAQDTELALEAGYADFGGAAHKLLVRQCKCNLELGRIAHAQKSFDAAVDAIDRSGISKDLRQGLATELQVQIEVRVSAAKTFLNTFCVKVLHVGKFHTKFCRRPSSTWPGKAAPSTQGETRRPRWRARRRGGSSRRGQRLRKTTRRSRGHRHRWSWPTTPFVADTS